MVILLPVTRALVPVDSEAATRISAPNYDEFQSDREVWDLIQSRPENVLKVTMAHCDVPSLEDAPQEGGPEALQHSGQQMQKLVASDLTREVTNLLWVYEIISPKRPDAPQIGVGGFAATHQIRTAENPQGAIVRNEGIRPEKAEGRARLIEATNAYIGTVNLCVRDTSGRLLSELNQISRARGCDFETEDEAGNRHRVWLVTQPPEQAELIACLAEEPAAYVADGNHRSAAADALGYDAFLAVIFPTSRLGLEPYNRLLPLNGVSVESFREQIRDMFEVHDLGACDPYRPDDVHQIGVYVDGTWSQLTPKPEAYDPSHAAQSIDSDIVQRHIIDAILGLSDARDKRINYVGGNKSAAFLMDRVNSGDYDVAISLAPVTMQQFVEVCEQNLFMPPKSTWFDPKIRSGLVVALLDQR